MIVSLIAAVARDGLIGREGRLPWHLPRDLKRFRALTWGKPIIMGRRTFESLGRPLDGRQNIVLTRRADLSLEGCQVAHSLDEALALALAAGHLHLGDASSAEALIIGGGELFREALPLARRVYLTTVEGDFEGDVRFPLEALGSPSWRVVLEESWPPDAKNPHPHQFAVLERDDRAPLQPAQAPS